MRISPITYSFLKKSGTNEVNMKIFMNVQRIFLFSLFIAGNFLRQQHRMNIWQNTT